MILVFLYTLIMVSFGISAKLIRLLYDSIIQNKKDKEQLDSYVQVLCHPILDKYQTFPVPVEQKSHASA